MSVRHVVQVLLTGLAVSLAACGDECPPSGAIAFSTAAPDAASDWRAEIDSVVAVAPPDSIIDITVFLDPRAKQAFYAWADSVGAVVEYEFVSFVGIHFVTRVDALPSLKTVDGITGISWNNAPRSGNVCAVQSRPRRAVEGTS